ncbi:MAG: hypothetical protein KH899_01905 [Haemophilus pittmaniae]|uniref:hypothetical protein n=1 Tax=Haemophilus pittmaniae TaxID=249188 RepID=UPI0023F16F38|nr:hypothetical protein [Haemophilus pittmaniae]MBS6026347.1 hypothetical protein [Haemophilus pittmaniae]
MGILDSMSQQDQSPAMGQPSPGMPGGEQSGGMAQMYQMLMQNSINAISGVAQERIEQKGPMDGIADLIAMAMISNLKAAQQNGKTIPPQVMMQVAKDLATQLLQQVGVPEEQIDDVLIDILMSALDQFGEATNGALPPEEEQQYVDMINKISEIENQRQAQGAHQQSMQQGV